MFHLDLKVLRKKAAAKILSKGLKDGVLTHNILKWASAIVLVIESNEEYRPCVRQALDILQGKKHFLAFAYQTSNAIGNITRHR